MFKQKTVKIATIATLGIITLFAIFSGSLSAVTNHAHHNTGITESGFLSEFWKLITLQQYNTRIVLFGTTLMGIASGIVGTFLLLRKRALLSDAISHSTLPGVVLAFIIMFIMTNEGKNFAVLLLGAGFFGIIGMVTVIAIRKYSKIKDDAALGIVLSVYFGLGIALLNLATRMEGAQAAGLNTFIYGKPASMLRSDLYLIGGMAVAIIITNWIFFKEFSILCFDQDSAFVQGWPVWKLDFLLMFMVVIVTIIGLPIIGLILMVAFLVIPPASARFWTDDLKSMLVISAIIGGISGFLGSAISALVENMPTGAVIVLVAAAIFFISTVIGSKKGLLIQYLTHLRLNNKIDQQNLLRTIYEILESRDQHQELEKNSVSFKKLLRQRSWSKYRLKFALHLAKQKDWVVFLDSGRIKLTKYGAVEARRVVRNHRLWEMYLITHADIAPAYVDRDAEKIEHVLNDEMIDRLEKLIKTEQPERQVPPSPHALDLIGGDGI